jgi:hypothetical protein
MNREEFDALREEVEGYTARLREWERHNRGGTTLGELAESGDLAEGLARLYADPDYQRRLVRHMLEDWLGDPEEEKPFGPPVGRLYNPFCVPINLVGESAEESVRETLAAGPEEVGARAGRVLTERKARTRIERLRERARLAGELADAFEGRLRDEGTIRRLK